jgi:cytochrome c-type biogenesis protein CcmE
MAAQKAKYLRFGIVIAVIVVALGYVAVLGFEEGKSLYVTVAELRKMGDGAQNRRLSVSGSVQPQSIHQVGTNADFVIYETDPQSKQTQTLRVSYKGTEPPPDTFKDNSLALVIGEYGKDGVFHAKEIQAKCASKYAAQQQASASPAPAPASSSTTPANSKGY